MANLKTWALMSNAVRARILRGLEDGAPNESIVLARMARTQQPRPTGSEFADRGLKPLFGQRRAGTDPGLDPIRLDMQEFARETVNILEHHRLAGDFDALTIFAAPKMLGILHEEMPASLRALVILERPLNLIHIPEPKLQKRVRQMLESEHIA